MGCNFDINLDDGETTIHIGKRCAAGLYCWDCRLSLCRVGEALVHHTHPVDKYDEGPMWFKFCPKCGHYPDTESMSDSSVGRELGFNNNAREEKHGVKSCASFTWALHPFEFKKYTTGKIHDEYGRFFTFEEFEDVLKECPIQFYTMIGIDFA